MLQLRSLKGDSGPFQLAAAQAGLAAQSCAQTAADEAVALPTSLPGKSVSFTTLYASAVGAASVPIRPARGSMAGGGGRRTAWPTGGGCH